MVPVKDLAHAKQRLAPALAQAERTELYRIMLAGVLDALAGAAGLAATLVVTRDPWAMAQARRRGMRVLEERENRGHTAASTLGARHVARHGGAGMLQVPGDLPLLGSADVDALLAVHGAAPSVTIAPSRDEQGSNGVACSPADLLPLRFGDASYFPHLATARGLGVEPRIVERPGFALDIDTPDDVRALLDFPASSATHAYLASLGMTPAGPRAARPPTTPGAPPP